MVIEEPKQSPPKNPPLKDPEEAENVESMFSPRFRSVAAMAGWDEEALLIATLVVDDTPDRDLKHKKRSDLQFKSPPTNSRRKRRAQRKSPISLSVPVLDLDEDETSRQGIDSSSVEMIVKEQNLSSVEKKEIEPKTKADEKKKIGEEGELPPPDCGVSCSSSSSLPCMDRLREELSCAICLDICFEPSTTSCGHSFCKKCLRSAAEKCGKRCPKCRQLISNGRSCTVNTVLWNTIQLLFPQEVEVRRKAAAVNSKEAAAAAAAEHENPPRGSRYNVRDRSIQALNSPEAEHHGRSVSHHDHRGIRAAGGITNGVDESVTSRRRRRGGFPSQHEDAALALRLQREEFMEVFRPADEQRSSSSSLARANLRAMATRAMNIRIRGRPT